MEKPPRGYEQYGSLFMAASEKFEQARIARIGTGDEPRRICEKNDGGSKFVTLQRTDNETCQIVLQRTESLRWLKSITVYIDEVRLRHSHATDRDYPMLFTCKYDLWTDSMDTAEKPALLWPSKREFDVERMEGLSHQLDNREGHWALQPETLEQIIRASELLEIDKSVLLS